LSRADAVPLGGATRSGVVGGDHARFGVRLVAIVFRDFFQIPAADLYVAFRVGEQTFGVARHLLRKLAHPRLRSPLAPDRRRHLHQPDLGVLTDLPRAEIRLLVNDAPHEIGVEPVDARLPRDERVETMNPVLIKKIETGGGEDGEDDGGEDETLEDRHSG
jgi:hypothetical protein